MARDAVRQEAPGWGAFAKTFLGAGLALGAAAVAFVAMADPYGLRAAPGRPAGPIMDRNQRFLWPQIARSGAYDAAVFGTSTARLLDPRALDAAFGVHFANLAVNAATPDEQRAMAEIFLRAGPARAVIFGLDATWCAADPPARTAHPFPDWLYAPGAPGGVWHQANWQGLEIAARAALARAGLMAPRARGDGYAVFTPPESTYDPARAAAHIRAGAAEAGRFLGTEEDTRDGAGAGGTKRAGGTHPASRDAPAPDAPMPALAMLDALLGDTPPGALRIAAFMPVHAGAQGAPGTAEGIREALCKARVAEIGRRRGAWVVDFRRPSPITQDDANYWDALHYRLPVAARIAAGLKEAVATGADAPDGFYRVLSRP